MAKPNQGKFVRPSRVTVPERAHPLARMVFQLMRETNTTYAETEWRSGVLCSTMKAWRKSNIPGLATIEAALGVFGWSLVPVPPRSEVPPEIAAELDRLAEKWRGFNPTLAQLMATVCRAPLADLGAPRPVEHAPNPQARTPHQSLPLAA